MRIHLSYRMLLATALLLVVALTPMATFAEQGTDTSKGEETTPTSTTVTPGQESPGPATSSVHKTEVENEAAGLRAPAASGSQERASGHLQLVEDRLAGDKLKRCRQRERNVTNIMARIVDRSTKQIDLFSLIASRTEIFYARKGKTLDSYSQLVAAVNAARNTAQTDLRTLKNTESFSCNSTNPKGQVATFQAALQGEIQDLKAFRSAVKNLVVGVKSVQTATSANEGSAQ